MAEILEKNKDRELICHSMQQGAEHYNQMIWTVFAVGVAFSLIILKTVWPHKMSVDFMYYFMALLGLLVLFYCSTTIERFAQKKNEMYEIYHEYLDNKEIKDRIKNVPAMKLVWLAEIPLALIHLGYLSYFVYLLVENTAPFVFINADLSLIGAILASVSFGMSFVNWVRRR